MPHAKPQHPNASLTPRGRRKMVRVVIDEGWTIEAAAERFQVDAKTVRKWRDRYLVEGETGLFDRSSRPKTSPNETPPECQRRIIELRKQRRWGAAHIGHEVGRAGSTVQRILISEGLGRLDSGDRATADPIVRYQRDRPGELVHVDVKKLAGIPDGGGWRIHGRVITDNGSCYRSRLWRDALEHAGITPKFTRPYRPQTNGKVQRFHPILLEEWAYIRDWNSDQACSAHYEHCVHFCNHHRAHGALGWSTPIATLRDNVPGHHS